MKNSGQKAGQRRAPARAPYMFSKHRITRLMNNSSDNGEDILLFPLLFHPQSAGMISFASDFGGGGKALCEPRNV